MQKKRILVAALNWGLGHAARCVPIIDELQKQNFEPIIASDGPALSLLQKEFPHLNSEELPAYNIKYPENGAYFKWKLIMESPRILNAIDEEKKFTKTLVKKYDLKGIISDNRLGVRSKKLKKNVFMTHQLNVLSGSTSFFSSFIHQKYIKKFDHCWIPDYEGESNLSGKLGHLPKQKDCAYIGPLSRFQKTGTPIMFDYAVILSGPEPQRSILESILLKEFKDTDKKVLFIRGVITDEPFSVDNPNINITNYFYGKGLQEALNCSEIIISRSGYSTIMDMAALEKKVFFIPTPGQYEQEYLAKRFEEKGIAPFCNQKEFTLQKLKELKNFSGLRNLGSSTGMGSFLAFFHGK